jgi:hypothetical protein
MLSDSFAFRPVPLASGTEVSRAGLDFEKLTSVIDAVQGFLFKDTGQYVMDLVSATESYDAGPTNHFIDPTGHFFIH